MNDDRLDRDIRSKVEMLEDLYPRELDTADDLWHRLSEKRRRRLKGRRLLISAAACVVLLALAGWWWRPGKAASTERIVQSSGDIPDQQGDAMAYVARLCRGDHVVCTSADFKALEADLAELTASLNQVNREMARFGEDEHLLRAKQRIEDHQVEVIRAMVQML